MYFLYLNKHSTCLHTQIHTFTHNMRKVYVIKTIECIIRKRGEGKAKKKENVIELYGCSAARAENGLCT